MRIRAIAALLLLMLPAPLFAQESRLDGRIDARTRGAVALIVDSTRAAGLPVEPLIDKALEGAMKGAAPARIIGAVSALARRLGAAQAALGPGAPEGDLVAAAGALSLGISRETLVRLRDASADASVATPLVVLSDLVARGVPPDTASAALIALATRGATAEAYLALRGDVARAIAAGAPPAVATTVRASGGLVSSPAITLRPSAMNDARLENTTNSPTGGTIPPGAPKPRP